MKNRYAQISFIASGYINQDIQITEPDITAEQIVEMLGNGEAITTIQDGGEVVRVSDWKVIGTVCGTEPEMDYHEYQIEGDYELVQDEPKPFNMSRLALACAIGEFVYEPEMEVEEIMNVLEKAGGVPPELTLEEGARDMSGRAILKEIDLQERGLMNLMNLAYAAGKNNQETI